MGFRCGIVGLPNVGKSTLFNALTQTATAQAENYPFCTIDPNVGDIAVPDPRLQKIAAISKSKKIAPTRLTFVDIAGLVRGASKGEGLGNQFLSHIREVDAIAYVLRCFEDPDVTHVEGCIDPLADAETIETELMLADLESLEGRLPALEKRAKGNDKDATKTVELVTKALALLREGHPARQANVGSNDRSAFNQLQLLTSKPILYVCNVDEDAAVMGNQHSKAVQNRAQQEDVSSIIISAKIEAELAQLPESERQDYLDSLGLSEPGLNQLIHAGYKLLGLITFFTTGPKESHAWTIPRGTKARAASAVIHTDFEKGFIRAETIAYDEFIACNGEAGARDAGKMRIEGKDYVIQDGDIIHVRFNV
jgi:GTP-binding protein YchF